MGTFGNQHRGPNLCRVIPAFHMDWVILREHRRAGASANGLNRYIQSIILSHLQSGGDSHFTSNTEFGRKQSPSLQHKVRKFINHLIHFDLKAVNDVTATGQTCGLEHLSLVITYPTQPIAHSRKRVYKFKTKHNYSTCPPHRSFKSYTYQPILLVCDIPVIFPVIAVRLYFNSENTLV